MLKKVRDLINKYNTDEEFRESVDLYIAKKISFAQLLEVLNVEMDLVYDFLVAIGVWENAN